MANSRIFYAIEAVGIAPHNVAASGGAPSGFNTVHGAQTVSLNTTFNLESLFELGQLELYENIEGIPAIDMTIQKVLDGYPLLYHLATPNATSATLVGRSTERCYIALNIYPDTNDNASGVPLQMVGMSGMYVSSLNYALNVDGNSTEEVKFVGNDKVWYASGNGFTPVGFDGTDAPPSGAQRREDVIMNTGASGSLWPLDIPGIDPSGFNPVDGDSFSAHIQTVTIATDLGRTELFELGRRGAYHRFVNFPVEVTCTINVTSSEGDLVDALADPPGGTNLTDQAIKIYMNDGTIFDLGTRNKLKSVTYGGADAKGGNGSCVYSYSNFNSLTVTDPSDPAGLS